MRRVLNIVLLGIIAVSTSLGAADTPSRIYVYADWGSPQRSWIPIYYDGVLAAKLKAGKFFAINAAPGSHSLFAGDGVPESFNVRTGQEIFVELEHDVEITPSGKTSIPVLSEKLTEAGRLKVIHLVYIRTKEMYSLLVSRQDPTLQWEPSLKRRKH